MAHASEVFDNEEVQWHTRRQAANLSSVVMVLAALTLVGGGVAWSGQLPVSLVGGGLAAGWIGGLAWISPRRRRLRRVAWCLKLSPQGVVTYDYARHPTALAWDEVECIDLTCQGLVLAGPPPCTIVIPHLFPNFADLSHAVVQQAEAHHIPVYIDGQPWEALDVYALFPGLAEAGC